MPALGQGYDTLHTQLTAKDKALTVALDALRKIRLGHPCDLPAVIALVAVREAEAILEAGK